MTTSGRRTSALCATTIALFGAAASHADIIHSDGANSTEGLGAFTGEMAYFADAPDHGILTVTLTNGSDPGNSGFITGFVFNINSADPNAMATLTSADYPFIGVANHPAPPFGGSYTAGAALGGDWSGGGNPNPGIGVGDTGTFTFDINAFDADLLAPASFIGGPNEFNFVVRFRGFNDGGSDKVPGLIPSIPGPATLGLLAIGALAGRGRRRNLH